MAQLVLKVDHQVFEAVKAPQVLAVRAMPSLSIDISGIKARMMRALSFVSVSRRAPYFLGA